MDEHSANVGWLKICPKIIDQFRDDFVCLISLRNVCGMMGNIVENKQPNESTKWVLNTSLLMFTYRLFFYGWEKLFRKGEKECYRINLSAESFRSIFQWYYLPIFPLLHSARFRLPLPFSTPPSLIHRALHTLPVCRLLTQSLFPALMTISQIRFNFQKCCYIIKYNTYFIMSMIQANSDICKKVTIICKSKF